MRPLAVRETGLSRDTVFAMLSNQRRRRVIHVLKRADGTVSAGVQTYHGRESRLGVGGGVEPTALVAAGSDGRDERE